MEVNKLYKNTLTGIVFRILWVSSDISFVYVIDIEDKLKIPYSISIADLSSDIFSGDVIASENTADILIDYSQLSKALRQESDKVWMMIKNIVTLEPDIYDSKKRYKIIKELIAEYQVSDVTVYKYLKRYWAGGKTKMALIDGRYNSGGRGKEKFLKRRKGLEKGININEKIKGQIKDALDKYFYKREDSSYEYAYHMMLNDHYSEVKIIDGKSKVVVLDKSPSYRQFYYWANKLYSTKEHLIKHKGLRKFNKDFREVLGSSKSEVYGPGSRFEIDATIGNIYLVSAYNRKEVIGRPTIYIVVDIFSQMIVGFYVGLENAGWDAAIHSLIYTGLDKVELCKRYGIEIEKEDWPSNHFPKVILGDKGEMFSLNSNNLVEHFNVIVENTASYRPEMKGTVEKMLDLIPNTLRHIAPGYIDKDFRQRGAKDYRLDAKLTLKEYAALIIQCILYHNNKHLNNYPATKDMILDQVQYTPKNLWKWGMENRVGNLREYSESYIYFNLLPRATATVTKSGIKFKNRYYKSEKSIKESWFVIARNEGSWKLTIAFDRRLPEEIYIIERDSIETGYLISHQEKYMNVTFEDIEQLETLNSNKKELEKKKNDKVNLYNTLNMQLKKMKEESTKEIKTSKILDEKVNVNEIKDKKRVESKIEHLQKVQLLTNEYPRTMRKDEGRDGLMEYKKRSIRDMGYYKERKDYEDEI